MNTRVGVISDLHANRPALKAVIADAPSVDEWICCGDLIGILGWNDWTVEWVRDNCSTVVFGNHDARVRSDFAYTPSFPAAQDEHRIVTEQLNANNIEYLNQLSDRVELDRGAGCIVAHSRPFYFRDPGYPCHGFAQGDAGIEPRDFTTVGPHLDGRTALLGHTHQQHTVDVGKFPGQSGLVLNPGSVGAPWYSNAEYAVVDLETQDYECRSIEYDHDRVVHRLESLGLSVGKYDNDGRL